MTIELIWQLPTAASAEQRVRRAGFGIYDHLAQIARAVELTGFDGLAISNDPAGEEPLIVAAVLLRSVRRLKLVPTITSALGSAVYVAKMAASFQRFSGGRLGWNLALGDDGLHARLDELLTVATGVWHEQGFTHKGRFFEVENGGFGGPLSGLAFPEVYLSGTAEADLVLSAARADVHLFDLEPIDALRAKAGRLRELARQRDRRLRLGLRIRTIARETAEEAESDARQLLQQGGGDRTLDRAFSPNLWQSDGPAMLVGSYEQMAERLNAYIDAGFSSLILSGAPALEEAYRIGEHVLPRIHGRAVVSRAAA